MGPFTDTGACGELQLGAERLLSTWRLSAGQGPRTYRLLHAMKQRTRHCSDGSSEAYEECTPAWSKCEGVTPSMQRNCLLRL
ncbi:hypothetical protein TIFTF001_025184 [Ficus carica]|uniref:Uncharacterized protein n=1 Tax=Ficus carica TaxID=3494 RepID=A0AA88B172_FICCA|nr:hypothetical protein TIFTF001_025184 [Ficus carica]